MICIKSFIVMKYILWVLWNTTICWFAGASVSSRSVVHFDTGTGSMIIDKTFWTYSSLPVGKQEQPSHRMNTDSTWMLVKEIKDCWVGFYTLSQDHTLDENYLPDFLSHGLRFRSPEIRAEKMWRHLSVISASVVLTTCHRLGFHFLFFLVLILNTHSVKFVIEKKLYWQTSSWDDVST